MACVVGGFEPEAKPWVPPDALPYPFEFQLLDEDWDHFSILMESAVAPDPRARRHRAEEVLQRAGELHAGQPVHPRRGSGAAELLRRGRVQLGRHRVGGRRGPGPGRVDRRGGADHRPVRRRHPALRPLQRQQPVAARPGRRGARPALRGAVAEPRADHGPAVPALTRLPPAQAGQARASAPRWAGSGRTSSPRRASRRTSTTPGGSRTGCRGPRPSSARPAAAWRCSTRRRSASSWSSGGTPRRCCSGCARRTWRCSPAGRSTPACSTSAAATRPT